MEVYELVHFFVPSVFEDHADKPLCHRKSPTTADLESGVTGESLRDRAQNTLTPLDRDTSPTK